MFVEVLANSLPEIGQLGSVKSETAASSVIKKEGVGQGSHRILKANPRPVSDGFTEAGAWKDQRRWRRRTEGQGFYLIGGANLRMLPLNCVLPPCRQSGPKMFIISQI